MTAPALANYSNGVGAVSDDNLNTFVQGGVFVAQVRLFPGAWNGQIIYLGGYSLTGDGGQGMFGWNSTSTATDDNGLTVIVPYGTVGYGAWIRLNSELNTLFAALPRTRPGTAGQAWVNNGVVSVT